MKRGNTDFIGGLIMVFSGIFFWLQMGHFTKFGRLFPRAIILLTIIAGIALLIKAKVNPSYGEDIFVEDDMGRMLLMAVICLLWVLLLKRLGFVFTSFFALGFSFWVLKEVRNFKTLISSFILSACEVLVFYYIFAKLLYVPLPHGILF